MENLLINIKDNLDELKANKNYLDEIKKQRIDKQTEIKKLNDEKKLLQIGDMRNKIIQDKIDELLNEVEKNDETTKNLQQEIKQNLDIKKSIMKNDVKSKLKMFKYQNEIDEMNNEVKKMEERKKAYEAVALKAKDTYEKIQEKIAKGDLTGLDKITIAKSEQAQNEKQAKILEREINEKKEEIYGYKILEENEEEYANLNYLQTQLNGLTIDRLSDFEKFVDKLNIINKTKEEKENFDIDNETSKNELKDNFIDKKTFSNNILNNIHDQMAHDEKEINNQEKINPEVNSIDKEEFSNKILKNIKKREQEENLNNNYYEEEIDNSIDNSSNEFQKTKLRDRILVTINEGKIQYQYENDNENAGKYDLREFKEVFSDMKDNIKNIYDPFLRKFLKEKNDRDRLILIKSLLDYGGDLKGIKEEFLYDMAGAENLGFRDRRQLRKVAKIVKKLKLNIENEECIKFSFKNDILKGIADLFKGTMKGLKGPDDKLLIEESYKRHDEEIEDGNGEKIDVNQTNIVNSNHFVYETPVITVTRNKKINEKNELNEEYKLREESKKDRFGNSTEKTKEDIENEERYKQNVEARNNVETRNNEENIK